MPSPVVTSAASPISSRVWLAAALAAKPMKCIFTGSSGVTMSVTALTAELELPPQLGAPSLTRTTTFSR